MWLRVFLARPSRSCPGPGAFLAPTKSALPDALCRLRAHRTPPPRPAGTARRADEIRARSLPPPRIKIEDIIALRAERWHPSFFEKHDGPRFLPGQIPHEVPASPARPPGQLLAAGTQFLEPGVVVVRHASGLLPPGGARRKQSGIGPGS